jgi:putative ABC transport system permease protein
MTGILNDLRYAVRQLRKSPAFAITAILTLALGIGATTAIYSIVDGVLLRSLPYHDPQRIVGVFESVPALGFEKAPFSAPDFEDVAHENRIFSAIAAYRDQDYGMTGHGTPVKIHGERVSSSLLAVLGVSPELGRMFTAQEDVGGAHVVVLNDTFWRHTFNADPNVLGKILKLDREPYTIIGVMPRGVEFPNHGEQFNATPAAIYTPMHFSAAQLQDLGNQFNYSVVARLLPGVSVEQASADVNRLVLQFSKHYTQNMPNNPLFRISASASSYNNEIVGSIRGRLLLLQASVLLVLLIACVDVANLLLARAAGRQREMALRIAVGAPHGRILRQMMVESLLLALAGGALGLPLAAGLTHLLLQHAPVDLPRASSISLNGGVMLFCFGICLVAALVTGAIPALRALRVDPNQSLYEGGRSGTAGRGRHQLLAALVTTQFALAMVLLVTAGLLLRSFQQLMRTDLGFNPDHVITMRATLPVAAYSASDNIQGFYRKLYQRASTLPGVRDAALSTMVPVRVNEHDIFSLQPTQMQPLRTVNVAQVWVLGDYFQTQGIRLVRGRLFTPEDRKGSQPVIIVSQNLADKYFPNGDALGQRIKHGTHPSDDWMTVVGIVDNVKSRGVDHADEFETYTPYLQDTSDQMLLDPNLDEMRSLYLSVRTRQNPEAMSHALVRTIHSLDPSLPITNMRSMQQVVSEDVAPQRFNTSLLSLFAGIALLLAAAGIGGVLAYTVNQRRREIGVRMALGAQRGDVGRLVLREGLRMAATGAVLGIIASLLTTHWIATQLYRVTPWDPLAFGAGLVVLFVIAALACWVPARRAASVDPMQALRAE